MQRTRVGRYHLLSHLASGGMGEIFLAEHTGLSGFGKRVVLKQIGAAYAKDASYVELFLNEARVGSFLNHPNIVHIFDVGHEDGALWLVMEYVDGVDLKRLARRASLAGEPLTPAELAAIAVEVLSALEEAHSGGPSGGEPIIHRDLSPENVIIARSGAVKVLDFGLAKWAPGRQAVPSMEGKMIFGKVRYMPPEQLRGKWIDVRADLFALGVVLYEALSGALPFGSGSASEVLKQIMSGPPPAPTANLAEPEPTLDAIVLAAIDPVLDRRPASASVFRRLLLDFLIEKGAPLPLESLRRRLHPASGGFVSMSEDPEADRAEPLPMPVARRCGKCGGPFQALFLHGTIVDRCESCAGTWLDAAEVQRLIGPSTTIVARSQPLTESTRAPLDGLIGSCPMCRVALTAFQVPDHGSALEVCPNCLGAWFDAGEIDLLEDDGVHTWFRTIIDALAATLR